MICFMFVVLPSHLPVIRFVAGYRGELVVSGRYGIDDAVRAGQDDDAVQPAGAQSPPTTWISSTRV